MAHPYGYRPLAHTALIVVVAAAPPQEKNVIPTSRSLTSAWPSSLSLSTPITRRTSQSLLSMSSYFDEVPSDEWKPPSSSSASSSNHDDDGDNKDASSPNNNKKKKKWEASPEQEAEMVKRLLTGYDAAQASALSTEESKLFNLWAREDSSSTNEMSVSEQTSHSRLFAHFSSIFRSPKANQTLDGKIGCRRRFRW